MQTQQKIQLIIKNAGSSLIQVIDNGLGMNKKDAKMAFKSILPPK